MNYLSAIDTYEIVDVLDAVHKINASDNFNGFPVQINFLRNFTVEGIEPFLEYHSLSGGLQPSITFGNYDMIRQEIMDSTSHLFHDSPDLVVLAIYFDIYLPDWWKVEWSSDDVMRDLVSIYVELSKKTDAIIALNTFIPSFYPEYGIAGEAERHSSYDETLKLNQLIRKFVSTNSRQFVLIDWERMVRILGENDSMDYRFWYMSKLPFKSKFLSYYAYELTKITRALKGKTKKCLVLDCDNTLWGGIVGEDGIDGINLDPNTYPGNIYFEFQKKILKLYERGVLVILCSKNNEMDVLDVLDNHPHCLLSRSHLSGWKINWDDKATNIKILAQELNLGLDSFVFVDDSQIECELIRKLVPEVQVYQVPQRLYEYPVLLDRDGLFDTLTLSEEDSNRTEMYQVEMLRKNEQAKFESIEQYLETLSISISVHKARASEVPRISQLTQKTNQFNLTTRRYSETQIQEIIASPHAEVLSLSVSDKFGDSGLTGVIIATINEGVATVDTFLMSCRVLGRNIEVSFWLTAMKVLERQWGMCTWESEFIPTTKNQQVRDFWKNLNFTEVSEQQGKVVFEFLRTYSKPDSVPYIEINEE